jgi:type IV pilus assembly protein PilV
MRQVVIPSVATDYLAMGTETLLRRHHGSALIEGLITLVIFSIGIIGLLMLLSASLVESGNARYRSEASLLVSDLVGRMWSGDRSLNSLRSRFGDK